MPGLVSQYGSSRKDEKIAQVEWQLHSLEAELKATLLAKNLLSDRPVRPRKPPPRKSTAPKPGGAGEEDKKEKPEEKPFTGAISVWRSKEDEEIPDSDLPALHLFHHHHRHIHHYPEDEWIEPPPLDEPHEGITGLDAGLPVLGHVHHHTHEYAVARSSVKPEHGKPFSMPEPIAPPPPRPGVPKFSKRRPPPLSFVGDVTDKVNVMALRPRYGWTVRPFQQWSETELKPVTPPEEGCKRDMEFLGRDYETRNLAARTHKWTKEVQFRLYRYWGQPMPKTPPEGNMSKEERRKMNRQEELRAARAAGRKPVDKKAALLSEVKSAMGDWFRKSTVTTNLHQLEALQAQAATGAVVPSPKSSPSKSAGPTSPKTSPAKSSPPKPRESTAVVAVAEAKPG